MGNTDAAVSALRPRADGHLPRTREPIIAEVAVIRRFPSADRLAPRTGLTRTERSSADHTRRRHISPQGGRWLRRTLVEAAAGAGRAYRAAGSRARSASRSAMAPIMRRVVLIVASSLSFRG